MRLIHASWQQFFLLWSYYCNVDLNWWFIVSFQEWVWPLQQVLTPFSKSSLFQVICKTLMSGLFLMACQLNSELPEVWWRCTNTHNGRTSNLTSISVVVRDLISKLLAFTVYEWVILSDKCTFIHTYFPGGWKSLCSYSEICSHAPCHRSKRQQSFGHVAAKACVTWFHVCSMFNVTLPCSYGLGKLGCSCKLDCSSPVKLLFTRPLLSHFGIVRILNRSYGLRHVECVGASSEASCSWMAEALPTLSGGF